MILNGSNNEIVCSRKNSSFNKIDNGVGNITYLGTSENSNNIQSSSNVTVRNTVSNSYYNGSVRNNNGNTSYSIRINGGGMDNNVMRFISNITGNLNVDFEFSNGRVIESNNVEMDSDSSEEESVEYIEEDSDFQEEENVEFVNEAEEEALREEAYRELLMQKRGERIEELNIFQYKNWGMFGNRVNEYYFFI